MTDRPSLYGATWNDNKGRGRARGAVVCALTTGLLAGALGFAPAALAETAPGQAKKLVLVAKDGTGNAVADAVRRAGGTVDQSLDGLETISVTVPEDRVTEVSAAYGVESATVDGTVELVGTTGSYDAKNDVNSVHNTLVAMGAQKYYAGGFTGAGVDVAVIDSGVAAVPGLDKPGKVIQGPDFSLESQDPDRYGVDTMGHGTHMAGLIAGGDDRRDPSIPDRFFQGAAPDARIISVKAADSQGHTDVSQVLAAIDWVVQNRNKDGLNIRVLNLAFGTDSTQSYLLDPLAFAVENAWKKGIFVVVSAGNNGDTLTSLTNPAIDPYVMAVGASDTRGTVSRNDDVIPAFSSYGTAERKPDLVAPGTSVVSLRVPGSSADVSHPTARVGDRFFKGSGTSQAAAYVAGAAALVLEQRPHITPDQLKELLKRTAVPLEQADSRAQGAGSIDLARAYSAGTSLLATQLHAPATGLGTLEGARGTAHLALDGVVLEGEKDIFGQPFSSALWAPASAAGTSFADGFWNGSQWTGGSWSGDAPLSAATWSAATWSAATWSAATWSAATWSAATWSAATWSAATWSAATWSAATWSAATWSAATWSAATWG